MLPGGVRIAEMTSASPRIRATLTTLLPSASPSAISGRPASAELTETESSGLDVANAAIVAPMMPGEMRA
jgi:hypothetical protein